jgi:ABC-type bacteriocin/lantibiotic exporter with double-glycine peptidase domain
VLGQVPILQQEHPYSCGAAALRAVLLHYDADLSEALLAQLLGLTPSGTGMEEVTRLARQLGFQAHVEAFGGPAGVSWAHVRSYLASGVPLMLGVSSWNHEGLYHFVVLTALEGGQAEIMDPNTLGNRRVLSEAELADRWKGYGYRAVVIEPAA